MDSTKAESVKLFSNSYLALCVAYFNELDTYAKSCGLNAKNIIEGVCLDSRIGSHYNNPSFGYGGYCLPKDRRQLLSEYGSIPQTIIRAIVNANNIRKDFIVKRILEKVGYVKGKNCTIEIYRLMMKTGSDNFRNSAMPDIVKKLYETGIKIIIYELLLYENDLDLKYESIKIINNLKDFKNESDLIVANRFSKDLDDVKDKVYTRDL